jgi:hypothetical protein
MLSNKSWININFKNHDLVTIIGLLCKKCGISLNDVQIAFAPYQRKNASIDGKAKNKPEEARSADTRVKIEDKKGENEKSGDYTETIKAILEKYYPNGFRIDSSIILSRFRRLAKEDYNRDIELDDERLREAIKDCGTFQEGKVFIEQEETKTAIENPYNSYNEAVMELVKKFVDYDYRNWDNARKIVREERVIKPGKGPYQRLGIFYRHYKAGEVIPKEMTLSKFIEFLRGYEKINPIGYVASREETYRTERDLFEDTRPDIKPTLEAHYPNGIKVDSVIELTRFKKFYMEDNKGELTLENEELKEAILSCGVLYEGKVYLVNDATKEKVKELIKEIFNSGALSIYYVPFFEKYHDILIPGGVVSPELLKFVMKNNFKKLFCRRNRVSIKAISKEKTLIKQEILRVKGSDTLLEYRKLREKLPYIPFNKIRQRLMSDTDFIRTGKGTYTYAGAIELTDDEISSLRDFITKGCMDKGWVTLKDYNFKKIIDKNGELTKQAIIDYYCNRHMENGYVQHGQIITKGKKIQNQYTIIEEYVKNHDICTLQEVFDFGKEITGITHNISCIRAAYKNLVRTGKNRFVSDEHIKFDIKATDKAIEAFVKDECIPIKMITTFAAFPFCGEVWNSYLLESFCLRFSKKFRLDCQVENSKNAGTIIKKECDKSYEDIMAEALAKSKTPFEDKEIVNFLRINGYIASRTFKKINGLVIKAKKIRGRGV